MHVWMAIFILPWSAFPCLDSNFGEQVHLFFGIDKLGPGLSIFTKIITQIYSLVCIVVPLLSHRGYVPRPPADAWNHQCWVYILYVLCFFPVRTYQYQSSISKLGTVGD